MKFLSVLALIAFTLVSGAAHAAQPLLNGEASVISFDNLCFGEGTDPTDRN